MEKTVYIYIILNPITNEVRYVGKTTNIKRRFYQHLHTKLNSYCSKWIFSLLKQNIIPEFSIIDEVTEDNWQFWETYWIAQFKSWGFNLTNLTSGGEGCNNRLVSKETRIRISNNQKNEKGYWFGKKFSDEHIKNMIRTGENHHYFNKKFSEEHKKKISLSKKGINLTTEHKIRIGNSIKGENNPVAKKVIDIETGIIYNTIREASMNCNIKYTTLFAQLRGKNNNKTNLRIYGTEE